MAEKYSDTKRIKWTTVKIKTLITWIIIIVLVVGGVGFYLLYTYVFMTPEKQAQNAIEKGRAALTKLENHEKAIPELLETASDYMMQAEKAYEEEEYSLAKEKADNAYEEATMELERLEAAGEGHKSATFITVEGDVQVRKKGKHEWIPGRERMPLYAGDYVKTGRDSGAVVMLFDGSKYNIKDNSLVLIEQSFEDPATKKTEISIKIDDGHINVSTTDQPTPDSSTTVSTPSSKTVFKEKADSSIEYNKEKSETSISVYDGKAVTKVGDQSVEIKKNEKIDIDKTKIGNKVKLISSPTPISPPNREIFEVNDPKSKVIDFSWTEVDGATEYLLEIAQNQMFLKSTKRWTRKTTLTLRGFNLGNYFWRVIAAKGNRKNSSSPSDYLKFSLRKKTQVKIDDKTPPPIEILHAYPLGEYYLISGKTEPGATLTVNNQQWDVQSDGIFKDLLMLKHYGVNIVVFKAVDAAGNVTTKKVSLELK